MGLFRIYTIIFHFADRLHEFIYITDIIVAVKPDIPQIRVPKINSPIKFMDIVFSIEILVRHISVKAPGYRLLLLIFELLTHHDFMIAAREINDYFIFLVRKKRVDCFLALIGNPILEGLRLLIVLIIIMGYDTAWSAHH